MNTRAFVLIVFLLAGLIAATAQSPAKQLIVLYPSSRTNSLTGEVDAVTYASGNILSIAGIIREFTGADVYEIELVSPYSSSYNTVLSEAKEDQKNRARPRIKRAVDNIGQYDTIFLGFPNWWASIPMPIATFLESYDLSGKKIIPFCTHGGGRYGQSISAIGKLCPTAEILEPFEVYYGGRSSLRGNVQDWLKDNGVQIR